MGSGPNREKIRRGIAIVVRKFSDNCGRLPDYDDVREFFYWSEVFRALQYSTAERNETPPEPIFGIRFDASEPPDSKTLRAEWKSFLRDGSPEIEIPSWVFSRRDVDAMARGLRVAVGESGGKMAESDEEAFSSGPAR